METKLEQAKLILKNAKQEHLLEFYNTLTTNEERENFLDSILSTNFEKINRVYEKRNEKIDNSNVNLRPVNYIDKYALEENEYKELEKIGTDLIKNKKLAFVTMAGGQGTRLGHSGPKGTYDIGLSSHKSIFEILCDILKKAKNDYGVSIPWYIMTSEENNEQTQNFFEQNNFFDYGKENVKFFIQNKQPLVDINGKCVVNAKKTLKKAADGHGSIFQAMNDGNVIEDLKSKNIEWVFTSGIDNILVKPVDPIAIGLGVKYNVEMIGKSIIKANPHEAVGVFCKKDDKTSVIEYSEISKELAEATTETGELLYAESHILCNLFSIKAIEKIRDIDMPLHVAFKKTSYFDMTGKEVIPTEKNTYKFESFIFDAFEKLDDILIFRVKREEEFAPVKNAEGVDSPETARKLYENFHKIS